MIKRMVIYLFFINSLMGGKALAAELFNHTAVKGSQYEDLNSGWLAVSAQLFNAPCQLQVMASKVMLTHCGAGDAFAENNPVKTPAQIRFYDGQDGNILAVKKQPLLNGNNEILLPKKTDKAKWLRMEVTYE